MNIIQGQGVSGGVEQGTIYFYRRNRTEVQVRRGCDPAQERARLDIAREKAAQALLEMAQKARAQAGDSAAELFETHAMFLEDEDFTGAMDELVSEGYNAEYAAQQAGERFAAMLAEMDDPYMQARAADIKDVTGRLLNLLMGVAEGDIDSEQPVILCAHDLAPSETIQLDKSKILAIATQAGSGNSHTAILARTMGIPAVCGLGESFNESYQGKTAFIVGETGQVIFDPDEETLRSLKARWEQQEQRRELMHSMVGREDVTLDGRKLMVYCNIGSPEDVDAVLSNDGQGVGLFRSEFLYLASAHYPTEEEQFAAYKQVAAAMKGRRVIVRTLDIGADKQVDYFGLNKEENPAMGLRAIRICLDRPEVFRTQLRALYRASAFGKIAIMFPMITSVWEVEECRRACRKVMDELTAEGVPFNRDTELGIMIETPSAVFMAPELARLVDFFSVGTNDLTQYTLACDRQCHGLGRFFDPHHPAVLRALKMAADAAHAAGIWIGICGELGADLELLPTFLALGIDELSVTPTAVLPLRAAIRKTIAGNCDLQLLKG